MSSTTIGNDGAGKLKINIDGNEIHMDEFKNMVVYEELHNIIPYAVFEFIVLEEKLPMFMKVDAKIEVKLIFHDISKRFKFSLRNFNFERHGKASYLVNVEALLDATNYYGNEFKQELFKDKKSYEVMGSLKNIETQIETDPTDDKQDWIRANTTEKQFMDYLYQYCYKPNDIILCGLKADGKLKVSSVKTILKKPFKIFTNNINNGDIFYADLKFKSKADILDVRLSPLRKVRWFQPPTHKILEGDISAKSLFTGRDYDVLYKYHPFPLMLDNMNTHENYCFTQKNNIVLRNRLEKYTVTLVIPQANKTFNFELLDLVKLKETTLTKNKPSIHIEGKYIVKKIVYYYNQSGFQKLEVTLMRDYFVK